MIDLKKEVPFGLGEKVSHKQYGIGQIVGVDFSCLSVMFKDGVVHNFYDDGMPTAKDTLAISNLKYVGQWVSVNDTLPDLEVDVLVHCGDPSIRIDFDYVTTDEDLNLYFANTHDTTTHWMYLPRLPDYAVE